jgi:hypothetical protein
MPLGRRRPDATGLSRRFRRGRRGRAHRPVAELDRAHPSAAASLREGLAETLTLLRLGVPPTLARTLRSTNAIESMISIGRTHASNVKRWRDGQMALRDTLNKVIQTVGVTSHDETVNAA